ncbi:MAG: hypothetical protein GY787_06445 [Alteromonadales bacterium]|nr:hypothetical protein [Alteromonadales bacterium]
MSDIERFRKHRDNQMEEARKQKEQIDYLRSDEYRNKCKAEAEIKQHTRQRIEG